MPSIFGRLLVDGTITNKSGGALAKGDVVVIDTANDHAITTTTTARAEVSVGVVIEENGIANNATGRVQFAGYVALVNVPASVTRGHYIETHTVAKQATGSATRRSGSLGQFVTGGTTPSAWLWGNTDQTAVAAAALPSGVASVATDQGTGSGPFVALATDGPAVTLIVNTKVRVTISTDLYAASGTSTCYMGCALSGANTVAAAATAMALILEDNGNGKQASRSHVYTGLTPGSTVFTAKYGKGGSGGNAQFRYRELLVECMD